MECKIDKLGRVALPEEYRNALNIQGKDSINICLDTDKDRIILNKVMPSCVFCRCTTDLVQISGRYICGHCKERLARAAVGDCLY